MMFQIEFDCGRPSGLNDINVWKCERTDRLTHGYTIRSPREPSTKVNYKTKVRFPPQPMGETTTN